MKDLLMCMFLFSPHLDKVPSSHGLHITIVLYLIIQHLVGCGPLTIEITCARMGKMREVSHIERSKVNQMDFLGTISVLCSFSYFG